MKVLVPHTTFTARPPALMINEESNEDPFKLREGQRILSKIESLCHKFRQTVRKIVTQVKQDEYEIAIKEVTIAQKKVDKQRMHELSKLAEKESRPMTALEKVRLQHMQTLDETDKTEKETLLTTPFSALLDSEVGGEIVTGLDAETVMEDLMSPFVSAVLLEVENLYAVNQSILQLAARCRSEALRFQGEAKALKAEVDTMKKELRENEEKIVRLQAGLQERSDQLEGIRAAHFKEVISVKQQSIENLKDKVSNVEESLMQGGRGFDPHLLLSMGKDAAGRDLDEAFAQFMNWQAVKPSSRSESDAAMAAASSHSGDDKEGDRFEYPLKMMRLENERAQMRFQLQLLRHGMETWRNLAAGEYLDEGPERSLSSEFYIRAGQSDAGPASAPPGTQRRSSRAE